MKINDVEIEDTHAEAFTTFMARILVTAATRRLALLASTWSPADGAGEALNVEDEIDLGKTPDRRPGYTVLFSQAKKSEFEHWLVARIRKAVMTRPTTATFDAMPDNMVNYFLDLNNTSIQLFGDGYEEITYEYGRQMYNIPRMDGYYLIETRLGITKGIGGGNFLILAESRSAALLAGEAAVDAINEIPYVVGGFYSSGSKISGRNYKNAVATTNDSYCACILDKLEKSELPKGVNCVYEVVLNGLNIVYVGKAMKAGIEAATRIEGVKKITAGNYGGKLGDIRIPLHEVMSLP